MLVFKMVWILASSRQMVTKAFVADLMFREYG